MARYLMNGISMDMLDHFGGPQSFRSTPVGSDEIKEWLDDGPYVNLITNAVLSKTIARLLETNYWSNATPGEVAGQVDLEPGDSMLVVRYHGPKMESVPKSQLPKGSSIIWWVVEVWRD